MTYTEIAYEVADGIATITLDRPGRLNAFTVDMAAQLLDALDRIDADDNVRVAVITGRGRGFCAGADLAAGAATFDRRAQANTHAASGSVADTRPHRDEGGLVSLRIFQSTKPTIAAFNGAAVGVGVTMTLPMDIRLAAESARFGFVFARRGVVPEAASAASVALARAMLWRMLGEMHPMAAHRLDSRAMHYMGASPDAREGVESFLEKRPAAFTMRPSTDLPDWYPWWDEPKF